MSEQDKYEEIANATTMEPFYVAAALRAQGLEIERLKAQLAATRRINEQLMAGNDKLEAQLAEVTKTAQSYVWGVEVKP